MTPQQQIAVWGIAAVSPLVINIATKRGPDAQGLSLMLLLAWVVCRVLGTFYTPPESMQWYPVMDALCGLVCLWAWMTERAIWKIALVWLFLFQCAGHVAFWIAWPVQASIYRYVAINNSLFAVELITAAGPGLIHVARIIGDWVFSGLGLGVASRARTWR